MWWYEALAPRGTLISSTKSWIFFGGGEVILLTELATIKLNSIPKVPIPSGEIPNHQFSEELADGLINLK